MTVEVTPMHTQAYHVFMYRKDSDSWEELKMNWLEKLDVMQQISFLINVMAKFGITVEYTAW